MITIFNPLVLLFIWPLVGILSVLFIVLQERSLSTRRGIAYLSSSAKGESLNVPQGCPSGKRNEERRFVFERSEIVGVHKETKVKQVGLFFSFITLIQALYLWWSFDYSASEFQFLFQINWVETLNAQGLQYGFDFVFGIDGISLSFLLLTTLLIPICLLSSWDSIKHFVTEFVLCFLVIEFLLIGVFTVLDLIGFYIFFEAILIPMFLIIGIWGSRQQKIGAAYYFFFYTLIGSVLMLLSIFYIFYKTGTTDYLSLLGLIHGDWAISFGFNSWEEKILFLAFFSSLAVKIPKFPFHIWLPQAHVEAPVAGSVILAGILIKLGGYGFIRYSLPLFPHASVYFAPLVFTLSILAVVYASFTTLRQTDLKRVIAYSSVSHMGVVCLGIFSLSLIGLEGSIFLQIAHGLVSSALFIIVTILYDRYHTRLIKYYRGMTILMPLFSFFFFFFTLANIGVPLSCNFIGEFTCLLALFEAGGLIIALFSALGIILSASYALFLYNRVAFGQFSLYANLSISHRDALRARDEAPISPDISQASSSRESIQKTSFNNALDVVNRDLDRKEFFVLLPLGFFTLLLGIFPNLVFDMLHASVTQIVAYL